MRLGLIYLEIIPLTDLLLRVGTLMLNCFTKNPENLSLDGVQLDPQGMALKLRACGQAERALSWPISDAKQTKAK